MATTQASSTALGHTSTHHSSQHHYHKDSTDVDPYARINTAGACIGLKNGPGPPSHNQGHSHLQPEYAITEDQLIARCEELYPGHFDQLDEEGREDLLNTVYHREHGAGRHETDEDGDGEEDDQNGTDGEDDEDEMMSEEQDEASVAEDEIEHSEDGDQDEEEASDEEVRINVLGSEHDNVQALNDGKDHDDENHDDEEHINDAYPDDHNCDDHAYDETEDEGDLDEDEDEGEEDNDADVTEEEDGEDEEEEPEETDADVIEDMARLQNHFPLFEEQYRLIKRIGEGESFSILI